MLAEAETMLGFLFADDDFAVEDADAAAALTPAAEPILANALDALDGLPEWEVPAIELALRTALIDGLRLKPRLAFGPLRVAVTGRRISPPLFESIALLGRRRTLARLTAARERASSASL